MIFDKDDSNLTNRISSFNQSLMDTYTPDSVGSPDLYSAFQRLLLTDAGINLKKYFKKSNPTKTLEELYKKTQETIDDSFNQFTENHLNLGQEGFSLDIYLAGSEEKLSEFRESKYILDCKDVKYSISINFAGESKGKGYGGIDLLSEGQGSDYDVEEGIDLVKKVFTYLALNMDLKKADTQVVIGYRDKKPSVEPLMRLLKKFGVMEAKAVNIDTEKITSY